MARYEYTIDENNAVSLYDNENRYENNAPNILQPFNPSAPSLSWTREEATAWVDKWIDAAENPEKYRVVVEEVEEAEVVEETPAES